MSIIAKQSFWMIKPKEKAAKSNSITARFKSITAKSKSITAFEQVIIDTLAQFERHGYVKKLKTNITSESLPPMNEDLLGFLYNQIVHLDY